MLEIVETPKLIRKRKSKFCDYEELATQLKTIGQGQSVKIPEWGGSPKSAPSSIYSAMTKRGISCKVSVEGKTVYISKKD